MKKVLLKDIVIPKGTVLIQETKKTGEDPFQCVIGLSKDTFGYFTYYFGDAENDLDEYFTDLKE